MAVTVPAIGVVDARALSVTAAGCFSFSFEASASAKPATTCSWDIDASVRKVELVDELLDDELDAADVPPVPDEPDEPDEPEATELPLPVTVSPTEPLTAITVP